MLQMSQFLTRAVYFDEELMEEMANRTMESRSNPDVQANLKPSMALRLLRLLALVRYFVLLSLTTVESQT